MTQWMIMPVLLPLIGGLLQLVVRRFGLPAQRVLGLSLAGGLVALAVKMLMLAQTGDTLVYNLGNWPAPFGIVLVGDRLYTSYELVARLKGRGGEFIGRNHQARKLDFRRGKKLGRDERLQVWERPPRSAWCQLSKEEWEKLMRSYEANQEQDE